jgi:hypothetical protein
MKGMASNDKADPTKTYILDETALTKTKTIEELAELAAKMIEEEHEPGSSTETEHFSVRGEHSNRRR